MKKLIKSSKRHRPTGNKDVDFALDRVYDDINELIDSVNTPKLKAEISDKQGKPGDIRIVKEDAFSLSKSEGESAHFIEAKTTDGWVRQYMDTTNHSGVSKEGTIPVNALKTSTKKHIKQGSLSFWKADTSFKKSAGTTSTEVYIDEDIVVGKNTAKVLYFKNSAPTVAEKNGYTALYWDSANNTIKAKEYGETAIDLGGGSVTFTAVKTALGSASSAIAFNSQNLVTIGNISGTWDGGIITVAKGGTGASNSNAWLNSRITTNADGSLNYDGTGATAVNHDSLTGFVANEHVNWAAASAGIIHATNYTNTTYTGGTNLTLDGTEFNVDDAFLKNDADDTTTGKLTIDLGSTSTSATSIEGLHVDIDRTGDVTSGSENHKGINLDMNVTGAGTSSGTPTINCVGLEMDIVSDAAGSGTSTVTGMEIYVAGADTNKGAVIRSATGKQIELQYDASNYATLECANDGVFTISTVDGGAADNALTLKNGGTSADQYLVLGNGSEHALITSNGAFNLTLNTNEGSNSGSIEIQDGADGDISITPNDEGKVILGSSNGQIQMASTQLLDGNGNIILQWAETSSAVNSPNFINAATGNSPIIEASGTDSNVDLTLKAKGNTGKLVIDKDLSGDGASDGIGLHLDVDRAVASSGTAAHNDIAIDLDINSASLGHSTVTGMDIDVVGATSGNHTALGMDISVSGADQNRGFDITTPDGANDYHIRLRAGDDPTNDFATFSVADTGDLTISTTGSGTTDSDFTLDIDGDIELNAAGGDFYVKESTETIIHALQGRMDLFGSTSGEKARFGVAATTGALTITSVTDGTTTDADITLDAGGDIVLDAGNGVFVAKNAGTEFSAANSAYSGMILGAERLWDDNGSVFYSTTTSFEVITLNYDHGDGAEDHWLKVTFVVPPSNRVKISVFLPYCSNCDGTLSLGLATDASDTTLHEDYEQVVWDVDESDSVAISYNWIIDGSNHSWSAGESKTLYCMAKEGTAGGRLFLGDGLINYGAMTMEAVAWPATIGDGT